MRLGTTSAALVGLLSGLVSAGTYTPAKPPSAPLAVRSPYLSTWVDGTDLPGVWPVFWTNQITGWQGFVSVDGAVYNWMGAAPGPSTVTQTAFEYTATKSIYTFDVAGKVEMTATFMSPVYPDDMVKQSMQFSYVDVGVKSSDGTQHNVSVYMDCSGEWASGDRSQVIEWDHGTDSDLSYHTFNLQTQVTFQENRNQAQWGQWYLATADHGGLTWQIGRDVVVRGQYTQNQQLANTKDTNYRAISDNWPVFAFAKDFGVVSNGERSTLFTIGVTQDEVVRFIGNSSATQSLAPYYSTTNQKGHDVMVNFFHDFQQSLHYSTNLDDQVQSDSVNAAGQNYATINALGVRQTFGSLAMLVGDQPYVFLKEISSSGDVQTVDVIFPMFPSMIYFNSTMLKYLLDPLFLNQEGGHWPRNYTIHDLGYFPNAVGHPDGNAEQMPLEECGNMIIMSLAYAQHSGDKAWLSKYYNLLSAWAEFLIQESLIPFNQLSTDDFAGTLANQTDLALKGMIGLKAMGQIAQMTGNNDKYTSIAENYISQWYGLGTNYNANPPHTELAYNKPDTWGLLYNLYGDAVLGLGLVNQSVYDMQSAFYPTVALPFGVPLDTRHDWVKADWECWAASIASESTRDLLYGTIVKFINDGTTRRPFTDLWDGATGGWPDHGPQFTARPVWGGSFAQLALQKSGFAANMGGGSSHNKWGRQ